MRKIKTLVLLTFSALYINAQSWVVYDASLLPGDDPLGFSASNTAGSSATNTSNTIIPEPFNTDNSVLEMIVDSTDTRYMWRYDLPNVSTDPITILVRLRGLSDTLDRSMEFDIQQGGFRERLYLNTSNNTVTLQEAGVTVNCPENLLNWHTFRIAKDGDSTTVFFDEESTPLLAGTSATTNTSNYFRFGDGNGGTTIGALVDFVMWDTTGAYAPGEGAEIAEDIPIKIGYFNYNKTSMVESAAALTDEPLLKLIKEDNNFIVIENILDDASAVVDLQDYDVVIIQEAFGSTSNILKPTGSLGLANITVPFLYDKLFAIRADRALGTGAAGAGSELEGIFAIHIDPANQSNELFNGIACKGDSVVLFKGGADDDGGDTKAKALNYTQGTVLSDLNTLLAYPTKIKSGDVLAISINDIPAGTTIGTETISARMISLGLNFGAMCKNEGTNLTLEGLTLLRNAVYSLANLDVPEEPLGEATDYLVHSYTFEDGTASDVIGGADGTLVGGTISNGAYTTSALGEYITLPADAIAINSLGEITLEAIITAGSGANTGYTMITYFGNTVNTFGSNGTFMCAARGDNVSRAAISCGNETAPWSAEDGVNGVELEDGAVHHFVSTIDKNQIAFYIDGELIGTKTLQSHNSIDSLSNNFAYLCKGGYSGDPTWIGSVHEFNIYRKALSADEVESNYEKIPTDYYLKHSYTFEDGTADDVVGEANGTLVGGTIADGAYTTSALGEYIDLPAADIAINSFNEITLEALITAGNGANTGYTMITYLGNTVNTFGSNGTFMCAARGDNVSRAAISCGNETAPWSAEDGVNGPELEDGAVHHLVSTIDDEIISFYIDGVLIGTDSLQDNNAIDSLSNTFAYLCKGGYSGDPTWIGTIHEFNIYNKALTLNRIKRNYVDFSLQHSYTFEDGTADDVIGEADGTLVGGAIADGAYTTSALGEYITLPAADIAINTYDELTLETWITAGNGVNTGYTMLTYFGNTVNTFGSNGTFMCAARGDNVSRAAISCGNETAPWSAEDGVNGPELEDSAFHHLVSTIDDEIISFYIDGVLIGTDSLQDNNAIDSLSNTFAYLCKGGYSGDPTWIGTMHEFNIYSIALTEDEVAEQFQKGPKSGFDVVDTIAPVITSVHNDTVLEATCEAALPDFTVDVVATDDIDTELKITQSPVAGTIIMGTTNAVTITVRDDNGNTDEVTFNVGITPDTEDPVISSTYSDLTLDGDDLGEMKCPDYTGDVVATDNCDNDLTITQSPVAGTIISGDDNTITLYAEDNEGNIDSVSFNITVKLVPVVGIPDAIASFPFDVDFEDINGVVSSLVYGDVTLVEDSIRGMVASFAGGTDTATNYIDLGTNAYNGLAAVTYSVWFNANSMDTWARLFEANNVGTVRPYSFLSIANGRLGSRLGWTVDNLSTEVEIDNPDTLDLGEWNMVTCSQDAFGIKLWVNGVLVNEATISASPAAGSIAKFMLGRAMWNDPVYNGKMDDFRIFGKTLSDKEVELLYEATKVTIPEPYASFPFDTDFADEKGNVSSLVHGDITLVNDGARDMVASFPGGTDTTTNYIDLGVNAYNGHEALTYSAWINANALSTWSRVFEANNFGTTRPYSFLAVSNGRLSGRLGWTVDNLSTEVEIDNPTAIETLKWYMVTCSQDSVGIKLWVNGELVNEDSIPASPAAMGTIGKFMLGRAMWNDPLYNGKMDNFEIYTEVLSDEQVKALYLINMPGTVDAEAPVITSTHNDVTLTGDCSAALPDYTGDIVATDNMDTALTVVQTPAAGTLISGLTNLVTLVVFDDFANSDTASFNAAGPVDTEDPVITKAINDTSIAGDANGEKSLPNFANMITATDNCDASLTKTQDPAAGTTISGETNTVTITVTDDSGNQTILTFNVSVVGIETLSENGISIYPNPTTGLIYLKSEGKQIQNVKVLDITGKTLLDRNDISIDGTLDLSEFAGNMYIIRIQTENTTLNTTIIKK